MKNKEKIFIELKELSNNLDITKKKGLTAEEIAARLNIKRNVVSHFLNELHKEGKVVKINTRPVYFIDKEFYEKQSNLLSKQKLNAEPIVKVPNEDPFIRLIGYNGSLKTQVKLCKSAASYPPNGLPILLIGHTGVGKSFIAQLIYEYAKSINFIDRNAPYIIFNCAEYADNPELLSANLFGYIKGAFTGADKDKSGLLEEADGGYLFLDEVHRLPPEGQEKLFLFLDKGLFRRLGETGNWRTSKVRFIFATTEDPERTLIKTFLRRIPLVVNIPPLSDRPLHEKLQLIYNFYKIEAKNLGMDILISKQVLNTLLRANISGNIGKMINVIKYSCAQAYSQMLKDKISILRIHLYDLPRDIQYDADDILKGNSQFNGMFISQNKIDKYFADDIENDKIISEITEKILDLFVKFKNENLNIEKIKNESLMYLNQLSDTIVFSDDENRVDSLLFNAIKSVIDNVLNIIENNYGIKYYGNTAIVLTHFTNKLLEDISEKYASKVESTVDALKNTFPKEFIIANKMVELIEVNLDAKLDRIAVVYFTLYIKSMNKNDNVSMINSIIIAHGYSTASSIASVANRLLGYFIFESFDMPIDMSTQDIMLKVESYLKNIDTSKGIIILVDMGSLEDIYKSLINVVDGDIGIINNITTQLALDVGSRIIQGQSLEQIVVESVKKNNSTYKYIKSNKNKKSGIITTCMTGIGTAVKIKDLLNECLANDGIEIIAYDYDRLKGNGFKDEIFKNYNIKLIIGTADPGIKEVPYMSLEDLITGRGDIVFNKVLKDLTDIKKIERVNQLIVKLFSLQNVLNYLTILNPDKIIDQVEKAISDLEISLGFKFSNDLKIGLYIHISCLIERLIMKDPIMSYSNLNEFEKHHRQFINLIRSSFSVIEDIYKVQIPTSEIGFIYDIIHQKINDLAI
ncbi:sigma 54-interacting transcriptional regulator [Thermoanaerobacterium butyriciformans]|uniref:Sigma-54 dependent transcriptional regulator of gfr operon n=1 Tax=Thermoanaerobacterium butyriciformans TaxID=1702242 RepID=A0ABS4NH57_9THEO|nr:sigma-54-dependent transcriptional regulator [Thermoanaerobacterium butyriciformans]MBP2072992.1 sigma-54 dependent transcriptional regulator of gfr operon [Thermoanaerobacterium butyriciformans]